MLTSPQVVTGGQTPRPYEGHGPARSPFRLGCKPRSSGRRHAGRVRARACVCSLERYNDLTSACDPGGETAVALYTHRRTRTTSSGAKADHCSKGLPDSIRIAGADMDGYDGLVPGKPGHREPDRREIETRQRIQAFVRASSSALFRIDIVRDLYVYRFQEVHQWIPKPIVV